MLNGTLADEVNIYTSRHYDSDVQLYEKFTAKTGIKVNVVSGKDKALQKRIKEEQRELLKSFTEKAKQLRLMPREEPDDWNG